MPTTLNIIKFQLLLLYFFSTLALPSDAFDLVIPVAQNKNISINVRNNQVIAKDSDKNIIYFVGSPLANKLKKANEMYLLKYKSKTRSPLFVILTREPSQPMKKGQGYCGDGHEDFLLLIESVNRKIVLVDRLLLQSCLKSILISSDTGGDDPVRLLVAGRDNSFSFKWETDDDNLERRLTVKDGRFVLSLGHPDQSNGHLKKVFIDKNNNVHALFANGRERKLTTDGRVSGVKFPPDRDTIIWLIPNNWNAEGDLTPGGSKLAVYRAGRLQHISCEPFIRDYWFWMNGKQIAIECGARHFAGMLNLYDTSSLRKIDSIFEPDVPEEKRPEWSKLRANSEECTIR